MSAIDPGARIDYGGAVGHRFSGLALAACLAHASVAFAQGPEAPRTVQTTDLLNQAQGLFDDQRYEDSIQTLSAALVRPDKTRDQQLEINRLLAFNYITLGRSDEAESAVRAVFVLAPGYALPAAESPRFRDFFAAVKARWEAEGRPGLPEEPPPPVTMRHAPPPQAEPGQQIALVARVSDPGHRVQVVRLFYRGGAQKAFETRVARIEGESVRVDIPPHVVKPPLVEYYFLALDAGGHALTSRGEASAPLRIAVPEKSKSWLIPAIAGGTILGAAAIVGGLALFGAFKSDPPPPAAGTSIVNVRVSE